MEQDVGVRGVLLGSPGGLSRGDSMMPCQSGAPALALALEAVGADPAVAVGRLPVGDVDRVDHPVAVEPVVAAVRLVLWVGTVADVDAVQVVGDLAHDLEVASGSARRGSARRVRE